MKTRLIATWLFFAIFSVPTLANDGSILQKRLNHINSFHAYFTKYVIGNEGTSIQEEGELWIKRPNFFNWHMTIPDEKLLISDGKTLWFYDPVIEQATAIWLKNATDNMPFMLITSNITSDWQQYNVIKQGDTFSLIPKSTDSNLRQITIQVTANGKIEGFTTVEQDDQLSSYQFKNQKNINIDTTQFEFILPKGVILDDQRQ